MPLLASLIATASLATVHLLSPKLRLLQEIPRSRLLSLAGGISVAYVVLRILPSLSEAQETLERAGEARALPVRNDDVYVIVLLSMVVFYALERATRRSRARQRALGRRDEASPAVFWLKVSTFALVNALIGYVLVPRAHLGPRALLLFTAAMLLKFVVNDHGLVVDHKALYVRFGRWLLAAAVFLGWGLSVAVRVPEPALAVLQAVIAGSILLNVLKEELPEYRESRVWAFALGAAAYAALLLSL